MVEFDAPFADNRQPRCPCVLVLDTSYSMHGEPIDNLQAAIQCLPEELQSDSLAVKRVEIAIVSFPPVQVSVPFCTTDRFVAPKLKASGTTPLGAAVYEALRLIEERKAYYRTHHVDWFRPWLFIITDGAPDPGDDWRGAAAATCEAERNNKVAVFAVGVPGAAMDVLKEFSRRRPPLPLVDLKFREMFQWLSNSLKSTSNSNSHTGANPAEKVSLEQPVGWTEL